MCISNSFPTLDAVYPLIIICCFCFGTRKQGRTIFVFKSSHYKQYPEITYILTNIICNVRSFLLTSLSSLKKVITCQPEWFHVSVKDWDFVFMYTYIIRGAVPIGQHSIQRQSNLTL